MRSAEAEVKPCPFCGQMPRLMPFGADRWTVSCEAILCFVQPTTPGETSEALAVAAWNTRSA